MKRGFLNTSKAKKQLDQTALAQPLKTEKGMCEPEPFSHGVQGFLPEGYQSPITIAKLVEIDPKTLNYSPDFYIFTAVPPVPLNAKLADVPGGWAECYISGHVKRVIYETPEFPRLPLSPPNGKSYRIGQAGDKGLGMFATRLIRAGELILDERPMLVFTSSPKTLMMMDTSDVVKLSHEQQKQIVLHEWGKLAKIAFDRMPPENQEAFMDLFNSHEHDGSDEIVGRIRTNGVRCDLEDKDAIGPLGGYTAVCKDISRINHCCGPNAIWEWHTDSFSVRIYATRDIGVGEEVTISYCDNLAPAAERAAHLSPYGIARCKCSPSCSDEAKSKISDERRARFEHEPITLIPPFDTPMSAAEPEDAWVQPAVRRLQELEDEGLEGTKHYTHTAYQLINSYSFLQNVEKVLLYANKLKGVEKVINKRDLNTMYLSEEGIRGNPIYLAGELTKKGMPIMMTFK
ncbi:hypothetical protein GYMLUDRAFT_60283 [Collybiopsis luxurians FD-317 M1]|uniref:SET domain-containing protein n=1 Tax=Collybiopsis luxurians FD-317 M1 TaxID=944289 RepID=A0A0D0CTI2_9AGAR|nr:hypothetical protein GYMLUDRAFT_60283 [Collybiopsis luxurians FD-317 M1]